jgi:nitronate monooxygenase
MIPIHKSNKRLEQDLEIVIRHKVPLVITAAGHRPDVIAAVHSYGGVVFHDAIHMKHAMKAADAGVDGIIPICAGGGGNAGSINPFTFVSQLRAQFNGTIILGGALGHGRHVRAAQLLGADLTYMGTRFIATEEANGAPRFKQMILDAESTDVVYTNKVTGMGASFLRESLVKAGLDWSEGAVTPPVTVENEEEMIAWRDIWSAKRTTTEIVTVHFSVAEQKAFWRPIHEALRDFFGILSNGISQAITAVAYILPWLLVVIPGLYLLRFLWRRRGR